MTIKSARSLFLDAVELPPQRWPEYLAAACAGDAALQEKIVRLLAAHQQVDGFMNQPAVEGSETVEQSREPIGAQIGPYELKEQIGEGGMGIVYVAEQKQPIRRFVALKVIKPGMDTKQVVARFEAERQTLAILDHPHIARVIDAGTTEQGRPYFVMELVRGVPITEFCDSERLPIRERLKLFCQVCEAVQHAHQKGIIHRDLKPSNVLVTRTDEQPIPKVIDFGIAKAVNQPLTDKTIYSQFAHVLGTPLYMSPEQAQLTGLDIDTRSDVYSLGVLLYELLTGTTPFASEVLRDKGLDEFRRVVREEEPAQPSHRISTLAAEAGSTISAKRGVDQRRLRQLMRGELDWIALRCLEKERNRRYQSASEIASDVQRYLQDEAVTACPPSSWYRFGKFARRNRGALATGILIALSLLIGIGASWWQAVQANEARKEADEQRERAEAGYKHAREAVKKLLTRVANEKILHVPGGREVCDGLRRDALASYELLVDLNPTDPELFLDRAEVYLSLPDGKAASLDFERALSLTPDDARAHFGLALCYLGDPRENGFFHATRAIELDPQNAHYWLWRGVYYRSVGKHPEMRADFRYAVDHCKPEGKHLHEIACNLWVEGYYDEALPIAKRAAEIDVSYAVQVGQIFLSLGRDDEALEELTRSLGSTHRINDVSFSSTVYGLRGSIYLKRRQFEAALADFDKYMELEQNQFHFYKRRAVCHFHLGNFDKALADLEAAMQGKPPDLSALTWISPELVASCPDEDFRKGMRDLHDRYGRKDESNPRSLWNWSHIYRSEGRFDEEREALEKAVALWNIWPKPDYLERGSAHFRLRNYEAAISDIDKFMELNPNDKRRWFSPDDVAESPPDVQQNVLELMAKWILLAKPEAALAIRANRVDIHLALDEPDQARDDIEKLLSSPSAKEWERFRPVLERLQEDDLEPGNQLQSAFQVTKQR